MQESTPMQFCDLILFPFAIDLPFPLRGLCHFMTIQNLKLNSLVAAKVVWAWPVPSYDDSEPAIQ